MPCLDHFILDLDVDQVLRAQAANPTVIRSRQPDLVQVADQALREGLRLISPKVLYETKPVARVGHEWLELRGGLKLAGRSLCNHLVHAEDVVVVLATIGSGIDVRSRALFGVDPVYALALDAVGVAALDALTALVLQTLRDEADARGSKVGIPLSPGIDGWPVEVGQPQLFGLLAGEKIGVRLTEAHMMIPFKSVTMIIGVGRSMDDQGIACDVCVARVHCRYRKVGQTSP